MCVYTVCVSVHLSVLRVMGQLELECIVNLIPDVFRLWEKTTKHTYTKNPESDL